MSFRRGLLKGFQPCEILVLAITAAGGGMAPATGTKISARLKRVQERSSPRRLPPPSPAGTGVVVEKTSLALGSCAISVENMARRLAA